MDLIVQDFDEINIEREQIIAKIHVNLEQAMQKRLLNNQLSDVADCARQIISLAGLAADFSYNNRVEKSSMRSIFSFTDPELIHPQNYYDVFLQISPFFFN